MNTQEITELVNAKYSALAASQLLHSPAATTTPAILPSSSSSLPSAASASSTTSSSRIARSFGYSATELSTLPHGTNLGLSCGNPLATAHVAPHEVLVDLGCGGGLDCLVAARQMVLATNTTTNSASPSSGSQTETTTRGKIYGIDSSAAMVQLARRNLASSNFPSEVKESVEFIEAPVTALSLADGIADVVISNCVINLVPEAEKPLAFAEMYRVLKASPVDGGGGGRLAISDILAKKPLPDYIRRDAALVVGCVAGASLVEQYRAWMVAAGFREADIVFVETGSDLNVYKDVQDGSGCCGKNSSDRAQEIDFNEWVAAYQIYAVK